MGTSAVGLGLQAYHQGQQEAFQRAEEQRIAQRDAMADLHQQVLQGPNSTPEQRDTALKAITDLYSPHEAPSLLARLGGLIHGPQAGVQPTSSAAPTTPQPAPTYTNELGATVPHTLDANGAITPPPPMPKDLLGIPISDPNVAAAHAEPLHPMATSHPIIDRMREGLDALGNHLKGFAQPVTPPAKPDLTGEFSNYQGPVAVARDTVNLASKHAIDLAQKRGDLTIEAAKVRAGGSSAQARYLRAFATDLGKDYSDLTPEEMQQGIREYGEANRRPQVIIDQRNGVANIVTRDQDGQPIASPMRDADGQMFDGFKPDKVTVHNGYYNFVGADNQLHHVPVNTQTTTIFGPHVQGTSGEKPLVLHKRDPDAITTPIASSPSTPPDVAAAADTLSQPVSSAAPRLPASGVPTANALAAINAGIQANKGKAGAPSRKVAATNPPISTSAPAYPGTSFGAAKLNSQDRSTLESDQQLQAAIERVFPVLEGLKDKNGVLDKGRSVLDALKYKAGFAPTDAQGEILKDLAFIKAQGALPLMRLGRNRKTVEDIQQHLPSATDTPARLYDNIKWLRDNIIPENVDATRNPTPTGKSKPVSSAAPKPMKTQNLTDRLNKALGK